MRSPQEVARRAFSLAFVLFRAGLEIDLPELEREERMAALKEAASMRLFLVDTGLEAALSIRERKLLAKKPGDWPAQDVTDGSWSGENVLALLWTLGPPELPPVWQIANGIDELAFDRFRPWKSTVADATLRPEEEIRRMADYLEAVRLREVTPEGFEGIPWLAGKAQEAGGDPPLDGDLPFDGRPYRLLDPQTKSTVRSLALERHKALAWVLGDEDDLDAPAPDV